MTALTGNPFILKIEHLGYAIATELLRTTITFVRIIRKGETIMKKYEVWCEGYAATGQSDSAQLISIVEAVCFKDAIKKALTEEKWDMAYFDKDKLTYWGCRFFDNEKDARKSFG